jgi:hypothetical protein
MRRIKGRNVSTRVEKKRQEKRRKEEKKKTR